MTDSSIIKCHRHGLLPVEVACGGDNTFFRRVAYPRFREADSHFFWGLWDNSFHTSADIMMLPPLMKLIIVSGFFRIVFVLLEHFTVSFGAF